MRHRQEERLWFRSDDSPSAEIPLTIRLKIPCHKVVVQTAALGALDLKD